jgi:hypothetical protein
MTSELTRRVMLAGGVSLTGAELAGAPACDPGGQSEVFSH